MYCWQCSRDWNLKASRLSSRTITSQVNPDLVSSVLIEFKLLDRRWTCQKLCERQVTEQGKAHDTPEAPPKHPRSHPEVVRMLAVLQRAMSRAEIIEVLGLKDEKHFREHYQQPAVAAGLIDMTFPDKPRSPLVGPEALTDNS